MDPSTVLPVSVRLADARRDAAAVAAIYEPHVTAGLASFEVVAPDAEAMAERIATSLGWAPWLVAIDASASDGPVVGYAYASRHAERAGYRWDVNLSAYVAPGWQGRGVGRRLYDALLPVLREQGFLNAYAGITLPNPGSVRRHEAIGMRALATYERVGWKHGAWLDVLWMHMTLADVLPDPPPEPTALPHLLADPSAASRVEVILGP
ncbi:MAG: N-acetyltransferase family protein [Chloroflexota bacterium]